MTRWYSRLWVTIGKVVATSNHTLDVRLRDATEICAIWGPVVIRLLDGAATEPRDIDRVRALLDEATQHWPSIGMLTIAHHGTPVPSVSTVRYSKQLMGNLEDRLVVGVALLGLGFWAEAGRASVDFLSRISMRRSTFMLGDSVEAVVERMALELVGLEREPLCAACAELERKFRLVDR
jgi:hypothetical protein